MRKEAVMSEPQKSRAVFSSEDFTLIRDAVAHYIRHLDDTPQRTKLANLYHRLGRVA